MTTIINSIILLGILGFLSGSFLAFAAKKFEVKEDVRKIIVEASLPGVNCGACGYPGCSAFAKAFIKGEVKNDGCLPGKRQGVPERLQKISNLTDEQLNELFEKNENEVEKIKSEIESM
ncbi:Fe-S protein [Oceanotoga sp. DSM 15011]|jgi:electron transport complex protein RnfB|uniref:Electron transport complex protein RnfB n=1 Tax=Oceanotoga teriensis TaxID=515440 RepID=A0AA45C9F1_9BACT|nr:MULTISPECIES: (Fe-S)-binding protein [Oceanotoga]MDN5342918.1 H+/Na+-translocating ferredoxin:NAD+ oxidoreductase subunit [Oceanotoga sp.]PWJ96696.1 electron transport complex protein RnfB [Oceanotoga teriensis]UYP00132.1 Fe-S protein [Oceanotoga sp. DSM 15011]